MTDELRETLEFIRTTLQDGLSKGSGTTWVGVHAGRARDAVKRIDALLTEGETDAGSD